MARVLRHLLVYAHGRGAGAVVVRYFRQVFNESVPIGRGHAHIKHVDRVRIHPIARKRLLQLPAVGHFEGKGNNAAQARVENAAHVVAWGGVAGFPAIATAATLAAGRPAGALP